MRNGGFSHQWTCNSCILLYFHNSCLARCQLFICQNFLHSRSTESERQRPTYSHQRHRPNSYLLQISITSTSRIEKLHSHPSVLSPTFYHRKSAIAVLIPNQNQTKTYHASTSILPPIHCTKHQSAQLQYSIPPTPRKRLTATTILPYPPLSLRWSPRRRICSTISRRVTSLLLHTGGI